MKKILLLAVLLGMGVSCSKKADNTAGTTGSTSTTAATTSTTSTTSITSCGMPLALSKLNSVQMFPASYALNQDISNAPVDSNSSAIITAMGTMHLHNGFEQDYGFPFTLVCGSQPKVAITYRANSYDAYYGNESDAGPFPIPSDAKIEGGVRSASTLLVCDIENLMLYELYNATRNTSDNGWSASCGVAFDLKKTPDRPQGYRSADASGLPVLPYLVNYDEVASGEIKHAIRFTISKEHAYNGYVYPANHKASGTGIQGASLPMGARLRLKASVDLSAFSATNKVILKAMKKYGIVLADIGGDMHISGTIDSRWDGNDLYYLSDLTSDDFEVMTMGTVH